MYRCPHCGDLSIIHIDLDVFWEMTIAFILAFLQIRLSTYEEVRKPRCP